MRFLREALLHYWLELRFGIRDTHILGYTIWMPLFLYPVLIFAMFQVMAVREGRAHSLRYTIGVPPAEALPPTPAPPSPREVLRRLQVAPRITLVTVPEAPLDEEKLRTFLRERELDGIVRFTEQDSGLRVELSYLGVSGADALVNRFERMLEKYRDRVATQVLRARNVTPAELEVKVINAASSKDMGQFIMAMLLPVTLIIFLGTGAFYTAIDVTAGERERGTFETTLLLPARREAIVLGKFLYVLTMAMASAGVNFLSLSLTMGHAVTLLGEGLDIQVSIPASAILLVLASLLVLGLAISPLMMGLAFLTRSFREGQSYVGPIYALLIMPVVLASLPGIKLTPTLALVPVLNLALGMREAIQGEVPGAPFAISVGLTLVLSGLLVLGAARIIGREEARIGPGAGGSIFTTLRRHLFGRNEA